MNPHWLRLRPPLLQLKEDTLMTLNTTIVPIDPLDQFFKLTMEIALRPPAPTDTTTGRTSQNPTSTRLVESLKPLTPSAYWADTAPNSEAPRLFFDACLKIPVGHHNAKRKVLCICGIIGASRHLAQHCISAITAIFNVILFSHDLTRRLTNAANAALMTIATTAPFVAATHIRAAVNQHLVNDQSKFNPVVDLLHQWRLRASRCLKSVPIPARTWHAIIKTIETDPRPPRWNPDQGHVQWKPDDVPILIDVSITQSYDETHIYWNLNGLRSRFNTGDLINLITRYRPTTLALGEIKTSLLDVDSPQDLQYILLSTPTASGIGARAQHQMVAKDLVSLAWPSFPACHF
jgi:hypothetical protein